MTTFAESIAETRNHLMTEEPDRLNILSDAVLADAVTLNFEMPLKGVAAGSRISIGLENYIVREDPTSLSPGTAVSVLPGMNGSVSAPHDAGSLAYINPQFSDFRIAQQINHCLTALDSHGLFQIKNKMIDYEPVVSGYDFDVDDFIDVWRVNYDIAGPSAEWPVLQTRDYFVDVSADITAFPSGKQFVIRRGGFPGRQIKVSYKASYTALTTLTDDVETISGLHRSAHEILPLGAAMRILTGGEVKRTFLTSQPEPRRQEEVPPGSSRQSMVPIITAYYQAIDREILYLHRLYPMAF